MAGESKRFKEVGIHIPKWAIRLGDTSILSLSIKSMEKIILPDEEIFLILLKSHKIFLKEALLEDHNMKLDFVFLDKSTTGQAVTLAQGLDKIEFNPAERLIVWCADSYIQPASIATQLKPQNRIYVSKMPGEHWSFAKIENGLVVQTSEKTPISQFASLGLYEFESIQTFLALRLTKQFNQTEVYIAPLYNQLIKTGEEIRYFEIDTQDYFSFGTPSELSESANRLGFKPNYF